MTDLTSPVLTAVLAATDQIVYLAYAMFIGGLALVLAEILFPGVWMGLLGLGGVLAAVVIAFTSSATLGVVMAIVAALAIPGFIVLWIKVAGPAMAITATVKDDPKVRESYKELLGLEGVAVTMLRPAGAAQFGDRRVNVVTDGEIIDANTRVEVCDVRGNRVVVRAVRL